MAREKTQGDGVGWRRMKKEDNEWGKMRITKEKRMERWMESTEKRGKDTEGRERTEDVGGK